MKAKTPRRRKAKGPTANDLRFEQLCVDVAEARGALVGIHRLMIEAAKPQGFIRVEGGLKDPEFYDPKDVAGKWEKLYGARKPWWRRLSR